MKVEFNLSNNEFTAKGLQGEQVNKIIDGFFNVLSSTATPLQTPGLVTQTTSEPIQAVPTPDIATDTTAGLVTETVSKPTPQPATAVPKAFGTKEQKELVQPVQSQFSPNEENAKIQAAPKTVQLINNERTLATPIGELTNLPLSNIRETPGGEKLYQTGYSCDYCGHSGKRFIPLSNYYTKCHQCNEKLEIEDATLEVDENNIPLPDIDGNYFIAREPYEG